MNKISKIDIIREFSNDEGVTYGVYSVTFNNKQEIFVRNGNSIGVIKHFWNEPINKCLLEIRDDVKEEFLLVCAELG
jgi:hypothetical protein